MVSNKFDVRAKNQSMILKNIIDNKNISRAALSKETGLNKASVSSITRSLIESNLVSETGIGDSSSLGGRKPVQLQFNPKVGTILSINIKSNKISGVNCFLDGEELCFSEISNINVSSSNVTEYISNLVNKLYFDKKNIIGLSIAIHGIVFNNEIKFSPHYDLIGLDLYDKLSSEYNFPIFIENEANLSALGTYSFDTSANNLVSLSIHDGIGAGIVIDGILQKGQYGEAGEVGHTILYPDGQECPCGNHGCFELYASSKPLYKKIKNSLMLDEVNLRIIKEEYYSKNEEVCNILNKNAYLLSIGINNISNIINPHTLVINSSIYNEIPELINVVKDNIESYFTKDIIIQKSNLGDRAVLYGGVALAAQNFLNIDKLKFV